VDRYHRCHSASVDGKVWPHFGPLAVGHPVESSIYSIKIRKQRFLVNINSSKDVQYSKTLIFLSLLNLKNVLIDEFVSTQQRSILQNSSVAEKIFG
jgi:hypothetical protein